MSLNKRESKPRQFPEEEGYRDEHLVISRNKRKKHVTKLDKVIKTVTDLINSNADINDINKANESLENIISKIRKITNEILRHELDDEIKQTDLNLCTNSEFKLIQLRNCIESYVETKIKSTKSDSLPKTPYSAILPVKSSYSEPLHHSFIQKQNIMSNRSHKSSKSSSKSSSKKSVSNKSSSSSFQLGYRPDQSPPSHTSYLPLDRRKTTEFNELLAEQSKERIERKMKILEKSFELQKEQLLEEAFEAESKAQLVNLERRSNSSIRSNDSISSQVQPLPSFVPKDSFAIYQNSKNHEFAYTATPLDKPQTKVTVQINKDVPQPDDLIPQACSKTDIKEFSSRHTKIKTMFDTSPSMLDNLQDLTKDNKLHRVARSIDIFIDELVEGEESLIMSQPRMQVNPTLALQQEFESRNLPPIPLIRFDGNPSKWPEFIENFFTRVHSKQTFDENTRMIRLISALDGEAKRTVEAIGCNKIFYATALKTLKRDFGNPLIVAHSRLSSVFDNPQIKAYDKIGLRQFHQQLKCNNSWLLSMGYKSPIFSSENLTKAILRLPSHLRNQFYKFTKNSNFMDGSINLLVFEKWLDDQIKICFNPLADIVNKHDLTNKNKLSFIKSYPKANTNSLDISENVKDETDNELKGIINGIAKDSNQNEQYIGLKCWLCGDNHRLKDCKTFISKSIAGRKQFIKEQKLCWNCLSNKHIVKECKSKFSCLKGSCNKRHHSLIHEEVDEKKEEKVITNHVSQQENSEEKTFLQVINVYASNGKTSILTTALLDSGSDSTLISSSLANKLNLQGKTKDISLTNVLSMSNKVKSKLVNFSISSHNHPQTLPITNAWVVQDLQFSTSPVNALSAKDKYSYLHDIPFESVKNKSIEILIGADHPNLHLYTETRSRNNNEPVALHTKLGWVLFGGNRNLSSSRVTNKLSIEPSTDNIIQKFWDIESYGTMKKNDINVMTVNDKRAVEILQKTTTKHENHYVTGLLWKDNNIILPNNKALALSRLYNLEKKLSKDSNLKEMYTETMNDYIKKGYAQQLSESEVKKTSPKTNYVPHHGVTNINKPNKVRVVFDAAAKYSETSLNQNLLKGPDLLSSLIGILMRFREGQFAIMGDIEAMFHQVQVIKEDTDSLRFLWRTNPNLPINEYIMQVHLFGKTDSPCCANWALKSTALDNNSECSLKVIEAILEHFYMDDYLDSFPSLEQATSVIGDVIQLLKSGGFK